MTKRIVFVVVVAGLLALVCLPVDAIARQSGVRAVVPFPDRTSCSTSDTMVKDVGEAYYTKPPSVFISALNALLQGCNVLKTQDQHVVVLLLVSPTDSAEKPTVLHVILHRTSDGFEAIGGFPGIRAATWVYITDEPSDLIRMQLVSTAEENPLIGQLGSLASTILAAVPVAAEHAARR